MIRTNSQSATLTLSKRKSVKVLPARSLLLGAVFAIVFDRYSVGLFSLSDVFLVVTFLLWLLDVIVGRRKIYGRQLLPFLFIIVYTVLASIMFSDEPGRSARAGFSIIAMCAISFLIVNLVRDERMVRRAVRALLLAGTLVSLSAIVQAAVFYTTGRTLFIDHQLAFEELGGRMIVRPVGFYWDPNYLGLFLVAPVLIGFRMWSELNRKSRAMIVLTLVALFMTLSRGVLVPLAALLGLRALATFFRSWHGSKIRVRGVLILVALALGTGAFIVAVEVRGGMISTSSITREMIWRNALQKIAERPWLGWGPGEMVTIKWDAELFARAQSLAAGRPFEQEGTKQVTHNALLQMLLWIGWLGTLPVMMLWLYTFAMYRRAKKMSRPVWLQAIAFGLVGLLLTGLFLDGLLSKQIWVVTALLITGSSCVFRESEKCSPAQVPECPFYTSKPASTGGLLSGC